MLRIYRTLQCSELHTLAFMHNSENYVLPKQNMIRVYICVCIFHIDRVTYVDETIVH